MLDKFKNIFYNLNLLSGDRITEEALRYNPYTYMDKNEYEINKTNAFYEQILRNGFNYSDVYNNSIYPEIFFTIDYISKQVAKLPIKIYNDKSKNILLKGTEKEYILNKRPNSYESGFDFKYKLVSNMFYYGVGFAIYRKTLDGFSLDVLDNCDLARFVNDGTYYYFYSTADIIRKIDFENITIESLLQNFEGTILKDSELLIFNLNNSFISPLDFVLKDIGIVTNIKQGLSKQIDLIGNVQGAIIDRESNKSAEQQEKENDILNRAIRTNKSKFLTLGRRVENIQTWKKELGKDLTPMLKELKKNISENLGVPYGLAGGESHQGKAELVSLFHNNTLGPLLKVIEHEIENKLYGKNFIKKGGAVEFDVNELFRLDQKSFTDILTADINNGAITLNEYRLKKGWEEKKESIANELMPKLNFNLKNTPQIGEDKPPKGEDKPPVGEEDLTKGEEDGK